MGAQETLVELKELIELIECVGLRPSFQLKIMALLDQLANEISSRAEPKSESYQIVIKQLQGKIYFWYLRGTEGVLAHSFLIDTKELVEEEVRRVAEQLGLEDRVFVEERVDTGWRYEKQP